MVFYALRIKTSLALIYTGFFSIMQRRTKELTERNQNLTRPSLKSISAKEILHERSEKQFN